MKNFLKRLKTIFISKKALKCALITIALISILIVSLNIYIKSSTKNQILKEDECDKLSDIDCIVILGAKVRSDDTPSRMLKDRVMQGVNLYKKHVSEKIIMTGDHGRGNYDEVNVMKKLAIDNDVPSENIFMDHAGFSTYDSMYRAKEIFDAKKIIVISQEYHLYRALHIANKLGLEAYGVGADTEEYVNQTYRDIREMFARDKDFFKCLFKPKPTYLGDKIPVSGNGDATNDK